MLEGWRHASVEEICETVSVGIVIKPSQYYVTDSEGVRAFRSTNVGENKVVDRDWVYLSKAGHEANRKSALREGDVLVVRSGAPGTACVIPREYEGSNCIDVVFARPDRTQVLPEYLAGFTNSDVGKRHILGNQGGLALKHFNVGAFKQLEVLLPPLPEQRKIAEILRTWDEALEKLTDLRAAKEDRLNGIAQQLLAPSRSIGRDIPSSNWHPRRFGDLFEERQEKNSALGADDVVTVGKYAIRKQSEHFKRSVASKDLSNYWVISPGDFVYDPMSAYYGAIGRFFGIADGIVSPAYRVIRLNPDVDADFMSALLRTHHIRFLLETRSSQGNKEGKRRLLQRDEFGNIEFKLPPPDTQREIAKTLATFRSDLDLTNQQIEALTRQKRGLMQKLLTGDWRVNSKEETA